MERSSANRTNNLCDQSSSEVYGASGGQFRYNYQGPHMQTHFVH